MDGALNYNTIKDEATNQVYGHALTQGIAAAPAQLYEAITLRVAGHFPVQYLGSI